jgi:succinate dehydrogenase / fumarate reductase cytochrome b subunit
MRTTERPVFFNLLQIAMPAPAMVSFAHRVSGIVLALSIPFPIYLLQRSLRSPDDYAWVVSLFAHAVVKGIAIILLWALIHHWLAGIRHLLFDIDIGVGLRAARIGAWAVILCEFGLLALALGVLL